ncbi:DNA polymerase III subunit gamma and tau [Actinomyces sp.]|uniref:DNA polymerase III subunit gamma and tau n=1 Tax=Actinomyces sp. TaxID=29317 RepID=UPI0026DD78F5|nr:DNA polymerase III subunit gamma and tau [Actinomyces sp.]MDO4900084.1 DNA polymerase III subunit gamma and tau [Actinomyces sp.]
MTTALYRRYRPDTFQDVIGQEHVTAPLMAALSADRVTHAYLFSGPRGCGKTTSARILARCLNCEQFPTDTPCGQCPSCRDLATGGPGSLDVVEIDAASHNGVDDARDLRERASFAPARDRYKIFILDEAHMVTPQGFNALLKLVEEPPEHVKFIFATTEPDKVIGTIRSRTHHYPFRLVPPDILEGYLGRLCQAEGMGVGPGVFPLVVRAGGGSVRDTLSVMDQLIGGAVAGEVDYQRAVALLGYTDTTLLDSCVDAVAAADGAGVFRVVDRVVTSGHDPRRFVEDLLQRLRDLLVIALAGSEAGPALGSLPADELSRMDGQARTIGAAGLSRAADVTAKALDQMVGATSPRLQLELLMARLLLPDTTTAQPAPPAAGTGRPDISSRIAAAPHRSAPTAAPANRSRPAPAATVGSPQYSTPPPAGPSAVPNEWEPAAAPERGREAAVPAAAQAAAEHTRDSAVQGGADEVSAGALPPPGSSGPAARQGRAAAPGDSSVPPAGTPSSPGGSAPAAGAADAEMIRARWEEVLEAAKRSRRATWALVGPNSQPGGISDGVFQIIFTGQGLVNAFENGGHGPVLAQAIHQALGLDLEVHAVLAGPGGPAGPGGDPGGPGGGVSGGRGGFGTRSGPGAGPGDAGASAYAPGEGPGAGARSGSGFGGMQPPAGAAQTPTPTSAPVGDDGWGEVAVPGGGHGAREQPAIAAETASAEAVAAPRSESPASPADVGVEPTPADDEPVGALPADAGPESPHAWPPAETADGGVSTRAYAASADVASAQAEAAPLATVHRLRPLPDVPKPTSPAAAATADPAPSPGGPPASAESADPPSAVGPAPSRPRGLAPVAWDAPEQTFSDGVPVPEEPGDPEGPEDEGQRSGSARLAAAQAAARAAASGAARNHHSGEAAPAPARSALEDDLPSEDDEDAEEAGVVGLEVVKRLLGATVLEEITVTQEGR